MIARTNSSDSKTKIKKKEYTNRNKQTKKHERNTGSNFQEIDG